jgi:hypothetical protein
MFVMKLTAKSKLIIFFNGQGKSGASARYPKIATDDKLENALNEGPTAETPAVGTSRLEFEVPDDGTYYVGSYNGDLYVSYIIVEANEAPGTPTVKVGDQTFEGGLWFREVTCKANPATEPGTDEQIPTIVTYTTDGTAPNASSPVYTEPIKCYKDMTVKFQAYLDIDGQPHDEDGMICDGADVDANVSFKFDAPAINADGATFTITSPYEDQGGTNYYTLNGEEEVEGNGATLNESATVTAFTKITNGSYTTFTSNPTSKDIYVLNPIKEKKTIAVTAGTAVQNPEDETAWIVENGEISADKTDFFVKNLEFGVVKDANYQIDGQEVYIKMNSTNITFLVAAGDEVKVKVVCSKNSCKNSEDLKCYVNVSGTNYGNDDVTAENGNIIEFTLKGGKDVKSKDEQENEITIFEAADTYYTFQKYSGTGNILISSIEITPAETTGISNIENAERMSGTVYNLAGQKVSKAQKGVFIQNGRKVVIK